MRSEEQMEFTEESNKKRVVIIGAGLSGLQAARDIIDAGVASKNEVLLLEAQDYIGGRIHQNEDFIPGVKLDMGAELVHGANTVLHKYADACKQSLKPLFVWAHGDGGPSQMPVNGGYALYYNGATDTIYRYDDGSDEVVRLHETLWGLGDLSDEAINRDVSLAGHLEHEGMTPFQRSMCAAGFSNTMCQNSDTLSLAHIAKCTRVWNAADEGDEDGDGPHDCDFKPENSFKFLVDHIKRDSEVRTATPVARVELRDGDLGVAVHTEAGDEVLCETVVVTVPPPIITSGRLKFTPALPTSHTSAFASLDFNNALKIICCFSECPWPTDVHGMIMSDSEIPEVWFTDCKAKALPPEDGSPTPVCYCTGFATAGYADALLSTHGREDLPALLVEQLTKVMSKLTPEHMAVDVFHPANHAKRNMLKAPSDVYLRGMVHDWRGDHPYVTGGYAFMRAGADVEGLAALSSPVDDRIFFAGEATRMPGLTADAAIESGSRVAAQVAVALGEWPRS